MLLAPGDYELLIDGTGDAAGPYAFRLLDVRAAATLVDGHGETVTGALAPASETRVHAIDLAEGESFTFDARQAPANAAFLLPDPFGRALSGSASFAARGYTPTLAGAHYRLLERKRVVAG